MPGKEVDEKNTWPLWMCLSPASLEKLKRFQKDTFGKKLNLQTDPYRDIESLKEIDRLMRKPPEHPKQVIY